MKPVNEHHHGIERIVIIDAIAVMETMRVVYDDLYPVEDTRLDSLFIPIMINFFQDYPANVRIYMQKCHYDNRENYRNFEILECLETIGLLKVFDYTCPDYYDFLFLCAKSYAAYVITNYDYGAYYTMYQDIIARYIFPFERTTDEEYDVTNLRYTIVSQYCIHMHLNPATLWIKRNDPEYYKCYLATMIRPAMNEDQYEDFDTLMETMHDRLSEALLGPPEPGDEF